MNRLFVLLLLLGCCRMALGQLTLEKCQQLARRNYPLIHQYELVEKSRDYSVANVRRKWLPQFSLSAQATYQSEVPGFPDEMTALYRQLGLTVKGLSKDQYKAVLGLDQMIWDGGVTQAQKQMAEAEGTVDEQGLEVEMYGIRERVNELYFGMLDLLEQLRRNQLMQDLLGTNFQYIEALIGNGTAMPGDLDEVRVEQLTTKQQRIQLEAMLTAYREMLSLMTGREIDSRELLEKPAPEVVDLPVIHRPELALFEARSGQLEARERLVRGASAPHFGAFVQGGYGRPGLNMFKDMMENQFSGYYMAGVRLQWNIGSYYTQKNDLRNIGISRQRIGNEKEIFLFNLNLQIVRQQQAVRQMQKVMAEDDEIIALRTSIRKAAEAKLANGTITVSDLLREINAENRAMQAKSTHEITWLENIYRLKNVVNE